MEYNYSDRIKDLKANAIREIFKVLSNPQMISFAGGFPASDCLPEQAFKKVVNTVLESDKLGAIMQYGATEGYAPFLDSGVEYLKRVGITGITPENLLAISGGQQGISLTFTTFVNKGDTVLVQTPTYLAALHILKTFEANAVGVKSDAEGLDLNDLEEKIKAHKPKVLYLVPNFSNPTGKTLGIEKRKAVGEICYKYGVIVLEDDPYRELRYDGESMPSIKSFDKHGNVIYVTSFSKTIAPGLRVGYACGNEEIIRKMTIAKQAVDVHTSSLSQAIVHEFLKGDTFQNQLSYCIPKYRAKRDLMVEALRKYMPQEFKFQVPQGGLFVWGEFDSNCGVSTVKMFPKALDALVAYVCGCDFFADGSGSNCLRLNFSNTASENIAIGVERLSKLVKQELKK